jgi:type I restriction enzyme, S subunit
MSSTINDSSSDSSMLGQSPGNWRVDRIRDRLCGIVGGEWGDDPDAHDDGVEIPVIRVADIRDLDLTIEGLTIRRIKQSKLAGRLINNQTILLEKSGGGENKPVGRAVRTRMVTFDAICSNFMAKVDCGDTVDPSFIVYTLDALYSRGVNGACIQQTTGIQNLRVLDYLNTKVAFPERIEQQRIAVYLDASCAAIDAAVAAKRRQLETLDALRKSTIHRAVTKGLNTAAARRASDVGWFGDVPKHWSCEHLKRFTTRIQTGMTPPTDTPDYYFDGTIPWFAPGSYNGDIELREPRKLINELARSEGALRMFPAGTVFLVGIGATIGKVGLVPEDASCNQQIIGIVCSHRMHNRYLAYQFKIYEDVIPGIASATTLPIFDQVKTGYLPALQPPREEQEAICAHLDAKLDEGKRIVAGIDSQIATLTAYRKSLIHECVTGQRRVTDEDVRRAGHSERSQPAERRA